MVRKPGRSAVDIFILNAARVNLSDKNIENLKWISVRTIDWDLVFFKSEFHGVSSLIYYSLNKFQLLNYLPEFLITKYRIEYYQNALRNNSIEKAINLLSTIFVDKIVLLKGVDLYHSLYPSTGIRLLSDIDVLVDRDKLNIVKDALIKYGCKISERVSVFHKSIIHKKISENSNNHLPQICCKDFKIEVHWNIFSSWNLYPLAKYAFKNSIHFRKNLYKLNIEIKLIHLCDHFVRHFKKSGNLKMLCDINELIINHRDEINWFMIRKICNEYKLNRILSKALTFSCILLDTKVPDYFLSKKLLKLDNFDLDMLALCKKNKSGSLQSFWTNLNYLDSSSEKFIYVFRTLVPKRQWIEKKYGNRRPKNIIVSYCRYWLSLLR